jgi:hypothetical protein
VVSSTTADGVLSTRDDAPAADTCHIDQIRGDMRHVHDLGCGTTAVPGIDREADSVNHRRRWSADGHLALVRADDREVLREGQKTSLLAIAERSHGDDASQDAGEALRHGREARLFVAEVAVVLHRPGKRNEGEKKVEIPGPPLPSRLIVTEVRDRQGRVLARWPLLTDVPAGSADAATIARWYDFRWRIESLHELLGKAGRQLESRLRRDGQRILIKLSIAFGAPASIGALERRHDAESKAFQQLLMRLSGRQTKR